MRIRKYRNGKEVVNKTITEESGMVNIIYSIENGTKFETYYDTFVFTWTENGDENVLYIEPSEFNEEKDDEGK